MIHELRILPPLAIARLARPDADGQLRRGVDPDNPLGYRTLRPAETLELDADSGEITRAFVPTSWRSPRGAWCVPSRRFSRCGRSRATSSSRAAGSSSP